MRTTVGLGYGSFNSFRIFGEFNSGLKKNKSIYLRASEIYSDGYKYHSSNRSRSIFASGNWYTGKSAWKMNLLAGQQQNQLAWLGVTDTLIVKDRRTNANIRERDRFTPMPAPVTEQLESFFPFVAPVKYLLHVFRWQLRFQSEWFPGVANNRGALQLRVPVAPHRTFQ